MSGRKMGGRLGFLVIFVLILSSCSKQLGNPQAYDDNSDRCSSSFIDDFSRLKQNLKAADTTLEQREFINRFRDKYGGVRCRAHNSAEIRQSEGNMVDVDRQLDDFVRAIDEHETRMKKSR